MEGQSARIDAGPTAGFHLLSMGLMLALAGAGTVSGCSARPDAEDAFVSYWQCAEGLVSGLLRLKSPDEYLNDQPSVAGAASAPVRPMRDVFRDLCSQLDAFEAEIEQLPDEEIDRLSYEHAALVQHVRDLRAQLRRADSPLPNIVGDDWARYAQALFLTDDQLVNHEPGATLE